MEKDPFLSKTPPILVAETCIMTLTVISYILPKKDHLVPIFQEALAQNIDLIIAREPLPANASSADIAGNVILRARFSLLLGYYADMLFQNHAEAFEKTMNFLFESVGYEHQSHEQVITLQSIDTLCTVVSDSDLAPRLSPMLPQIIKILNKLTPTISYPAYFEFLGEFVKFYAEQLKDSIQEILYHVVARILSE